MTAVASAAAAPAADAASGTFEVNCEPAGRKLSVAPGETILAAAARQGMMLAHSCRNGVCGTCKARVTRGSVDHGGAQLSALSDAERQQGYALLCQARPQGDLTVECQVIEAAAGYPVRKLVTRVRHLARLAPDVMRIRLALPQNQEFAFLPGQYVDIVMNGGIRRSVSVANGPGDTGELEFHLRNYGGPFSTHVFNTMKEKDLVRVEGPLGTFFVRQDSDKPIVFLASGTGFAPVKSMIEHEIMRGSKRPMTLYWGGRRPADLYHAALAQLWMRDHGVHYVPVISEARPEDGWTGRTGFVHRAVVDDHADLSGYQVYACGAPVVVDSARREFTQSRGLAAADFFADSFVPGAMPPVA